MNNYYELIYLKKELNEKIEGAVFSRAITPHKDVLECYLEQGEEGNRLIFGSNPQETALFLDRYRPPKKSNVVDFFEPLQQKRITGVDLAEMDRLVYIHLEDGHTLLFKLFGSNPNAYLIKNGTVIDAFKNPEEVCGQQPPEPKAPEFAETANPDAKPRNQIIRLNPLLPRNLVDYLIDQHGVARMEPNEVVAFVERITNELLHNPHPRVLRTGETCLWSEEVLDIETDRIFDRVNDCILHAYRNRVHARRLNQKRERIRSALKRSLDKLQSRLDQLRQADKSLERADQYEKFGHLLMAHAHESIEPGSESITVEDFYDDNRNTEIPLKKQKDIAGNAEYYYDKAQSSRKSYKKAKEQIGPVREKIAEARGLIESLESVEHLPDLDSWEKEHRGQLRTFGFGGGDEDQVSSPYRKTQAGKYEIWIGKSAKSNDQLITLAHKEDIWLHARGVGGSHVVIRMGNQKEYPPKQVILKAASHAAYYSKARGMKTAPVMYTKRKYVRKPKGADPGAVVVEREQVEMVPPMKPKEL